MKVTASQARFHSEHPIYYLSNLRILAGFSETNFHFISPLFNCQSNAFYQYLFIFPDIVIRNYLKIEFYKKPCQQEDIDNKHYIAHQKVCAYGC